MKSYMAKAETMERKWYVVDAEGMVLGRLASQVAAILRGKHKPIFTPHVDCGDHVIIINADKVIMTGRKLDEKIYYHHTGYPGGLKMTKYRELLNKKPEFGRPGPRIDDKAPDAVNLRVDKLRINEGVSAPPVVIKLRKREIILIGQVTPMLLKAHKDTCVRGARNKVFQGLEIIGPKRANTK